MPWTVADVDRHIKGLTDHQKTVWVAVANNALARCQRQGGKNCDATAIRMANSMAQRQKESDVPPEANLFEGILTADITEEPTELVEAGRVGSDGTFPVRIIKPGWGASGYYGEDVLQDAANRKVYHKDLKMFWNHPGVTEAQDRPERSLNDLAAVLTEDARYDPRGPKGPGLYSRARAFDKFRQPIAELGPHIGVSHRAQGDVSFGEAEGKKGPIVESILAVQSVDFVTAPGAGGEILQLFEAAGRAAIPPERKENDAVPELQEVQRQLTEAQRTLQERDTAVTTLTTERDTARTQLTEATTENGRLREMLTLREARDIVSEAISKLSTPLPDITARRLIETISRNPAVNDKGEIDKEKFATQITEAVTAEVKYLSEVMGSGAVTGMGGGSGSGGGNDDQSGTTLSEALKGLGLSDKSLEIASHGRVS